MAPRRSTNRGRGPSVRAPVAPVQVDREAVTREDLRQLTSSIANAFEMARRPPLEPYDGRTDVLVWLGEYERRAKLEAWTRSKLSMDLRGHLSDSALLWYQAMDQKDLLDEMPWPSLKQLLVDAFKPKSYELDLRKEANVPLTRNEDIIEWFEKRRIICGRLKMSEVDTVSNIITCLPFGLYHKLARKNIGDINELRSRLRLVAMRPNKNKESGDY